MSRSTVFRAKEIVGDRVRNTAGDDLGKIEDLIIDPATGNISYAVVGSGDRLHTVPWSSFRPSLEGDYLVFDGDRHVIERAPAFDHTNWRTNYRPVRQPVVVKHEVHEKRPTSLLAAALGIVFLIFLLGFSYLVSTRGWEQAKNSVVGWVSGVAYAAKETSEDAALSAKVKTALSLSRRVPAASINVDTQNEIVTLRGEVPNEETRNLAEMIARDTPGVTELHNSITVNPSAVAAAEMERMQTRVADLETKYLVHDRLTKHPALMGTSIDVDVQGQAVTLNGSVQSADQKYLAAQVASSVDGVRSVNDNIRVNAIE